MGTERFIERAGESGALPRGSSLCHAFGGRCPVDPGSVHAPRMFMVQPRQDTWDKYLECVRAQPEVLARDTWEALGMS